MTIIENEIQYNWVLRRVSKLKEKVDENTPPNNPYRIELDLLSKLKKEYVKEYSTIHAIEKEVITNATLKKQINIYDGLPMVFVKIKAVALMAVTGRSLSWIFQKLNKTNKFVPEDLQLINNALELLGKEISQRLVVYDNDRDNVIKQVKMLGSLISMPYIYLEYMKVSKSWFANRMKNCSEGSRVSSFKEDDINAINMAAMQIANELKSIEFVL